MGHRPALPHHADTAAGRTSEHARHDTGYHLRFGRKNRQLRDQQPYLYYLAVFLVGAYQEILGDMHNLFGDTNAVHVSVTDKGYTIDQIIDGETVAEVLEYVQYEPKKLVRRLEIWVSKSIQSGKISLEEGKEFLNNYRSGLYGYTYLE